MTAKQALVRKTRSSRSCMKMTSNYYHLPTGYHFPFYLMSQRFGSLVWWISLSGIKVKDHFLPP
uniref:Uncharacterized protein n=1 Tax=Triticum urartu TaxID=4572 RepID=A0A8R7JYD1_TRIUA